jgi:hypothetical protein
VQLVDKIIYAEAATAATTIAETETEAGDDGKNFGTIDPLTVCKLSSVAELV